MMDNVLIDTDVILDFFFDRQPFSDDAAIVLSYCERNEIEGYITPVILSNVYYLLRKTAKHELVIDKLRQLMTILNVLVIDKNSIIQAMNSGFKDFEDALQNFAAKSANDISVILTRNTKDFKNSKLGVMTPDSYVKL